jgi:hypothetical protein
MKCPYFSGTGEKISPETHLQKKNDGVKNSAVKDITIIY